MIRIGAFNTSMNLQLLPVTVGPKPPLNPTRIGVHTGDVVLTHEDFFGTVVNIAARIAAVAGRGEVFVSDVTRTVVGDDPNLKFEPLGSYDLPGQPVPSVLHALDWRS